MGKAFTIVASSQDMLQQKAFAEYEGVRMEVAAMLRVSAEGKGAKAAELFDLISGDGSGKLTKPEIKAFLKENQCEVDDAKLDRLFPGTKELGNAEDHPEAVLKEDKGGKEEDSKDDAKDQDAVSAMQAMADKQLKDHESTKGEDKKANDKDENKTEEKKEEKTDEPKKE